mgnify:CR=1 FL=1
MLTISTRRLPHAHDLRLPVRATPGSAGFDLRAAVDNPISLAPGQRKLIPTGLVIAIPEGWEGQVRPRSGLAIKHGITLINSPGTIDSDYRGELLVPLVNLGHSAFTIQHGERIAQILFAPVPPAEFVEVESLPDGATIRGVAGFGSTGTR